MVTMDEHGSITPGSGVTIRENVQIGLALSGGGVRAAVFHMGVLARLARDHLLEHVAFISSVSGGSIGIGLVYALSDGVWPSSDAFLHSVAPSVRARLTETDLQHAAVRRLALRPWLLRRGRAHLFAESMKDLWGVSALLRDVPVRPRWIINATAYESGKNWRFTPQRMGDYVLHYVLRPAVPVADAIAASAAYPGLIGPLVLKTSDYSWSRLIGEQGAEPCDPIVDSIHLWDGGVYDNLGVEALLKPGRRQLREGCTFLIVSDASRGLAVERPSLLHRRALRLVSIATDQVRSLRARSIIGYLSSEPGSGAYLKMGNTTRYIWAQAGATGDHIAAQERDCLTDKEVVEAAGMTTTLRRLSPMEYDTVARHGYEVTHATLHSRCPSLFAL